MDGARGRDNGLAGPEDDTPFELLHRLNDVYFSIRSG